MTDPAYKDRIRDFYDTVSPHFRDLWGEHLHDGLYAKGDETKEAAQEKLVAWLAASAGLATGSRGLDVGCGMGATSVWLARELGCRMHGITLSPVQVEVARELAQREGVQASFEVADAETATFPDSFDFVWMVGVLGHMADQRAFIASSPQLLRRGGRFVLADWVATPHLSERERKRLVDPVLDGMLMPDIASLDDYVTWFGQNGYRVCFARDIAESTRKTWDEGVSITQAPRIARLARSLGRDAIGLLSAIRGMRTAMDRGLIGYGVVVAEKAADDA
ncbi:MAG: methyltransferase domain-containing protein [Myxococcota bacterium]|nr:methyltransferase domain-containing protein [Myxococcota bacterium]